MTKLQTKSAGRLKKNLGLALYIGTICTVGFIAPAQADWFQVANIKNNLITPLYTLVTHLTQAHNFFVNFPTHS